MRYVAQHTSIPVPKVYCAFVHKGQAYIVMERMNGDIAGHGWVKRTEESKQGILSQLEHMVQQLRDLQPPKDVGVSNVLGGPIYDCRLPGKSFWGPFDTQDDFHNELRGGVHLEGADTSAVPVAADLLELMSFHKQQHPPPVLTHGDFCSQNILVKGDDVVGIIDWETAGWLPYYWEYSCAWNTNPQNQFWQSEVDRFLTPLPHELKMDNIRRKYFGDF
ncbi:protein kinase-like domain-containing protein [Xylariomycetidae sp. FL0641]|nr:protein kinase-like domain-containing protein [Xylariomycetidae sp. FL0641]